MLPPPQHVFRLRRVQGVVDLIVGEIQDLKSLLEPLQGLLKVVSLDKDADRVCVAEDQDAVGKKEQKSVVEVVVHLQNIFIKKS